MTRYGSSMLRLRRPRKRRVIVGVLLAALVVAGLAGARARGILFLDRSKPASIESALRAFRENDRDAQELEGVYVYATTGNESVDALGGAHHRYPAKTSVTARRVPCGLELDWAALVGRATTWTLCSTDAGIELRSSDERHKFFWQSDRTTYVCEGAVLVPRGSTETAAHDFTCTAAKARETGQAQLVGPETITVGGATIASIHARTVTTVSGENHGTQTADWWLDTATALPVRIVLRSRTSRKTIVGLTHYVEDAELRLLSMTPER
jgi:hypothetical protein